MRVQAFLTALPRVLRLFSFSDVRELKRKTEITTAPGCFVNLIHCHFEAFATEAWFDTVVWYSDFLSDWEWYKEMNT